MRKNLYFVFAAILSAIAFAGAGCAGASTPTAEQPATQTPSEQTTPPQIATPSPPQEPTQPTPAPTSDNVDSTKTIADNLAAMASLRTMYSALQDAGMANLLKSGTYTVFGPTNDAFNALPTSTTYGWLGSQNRSKLISVLRHHIAQGSIAVSALVDGQKIRMLNGDVLTISKKDGAVSIGGASVVTGDKQASNGLINIIDKVLLPTGTK